MKNSVILLALASIGIISIGCSTKRNIDLNPQISEQPLTYDQIIGITIPLIAEYNKFVSYCYVDKSSKTGKYLCINKRFRFAPFERSNVMLLIRDIEKPCVIRDDFTIGRDTLLPNREIPIVFADTNFTATFSPIMYSEDRTVFAGYYSDMLGQGWVYIIRKTKDTYKVRLNLMHRS